MAEASEQLLRRGRADHAQAAGRSRKACRAPACIAASAGALDITMALERFSMNGT
jgi:hypothetical protein